MMPEKPDDDGGKTPTMTGKNADDDEAKGR
jgi:hypothetical protein